MALSKPLEFLAKQIKRDYAKYVVPEDLFDTDDDVVGTVIMVMNRMREDVDECRDVMKQAKDRIDILLESIEKGWE